MKTTTVIYSDTSKKIFLYFCSMKNIYIVVVISISIFFQSIAQNVGIGTATPTQKLTVNGNAMLYTGSTDGARLIWRGGTGGTLEYRARVATSGYLGFFPIEFGNPGYIGEVLTLTQTGLVGIGHTNPITKLHIHEASNTGVVLRITSSTFGVYKGLQVGYTNGWYFGENNTGDFDINRDVPLGSGTNVFRILATGQPRMSVFYSRVSSISGTGTNNDGPTNLAVEAGAGNARDNDWPNGWAGGISTWDICSRSILASNYVTRSDASYKTNITSINNSPDFMQKFMQLNPVTYHIKPDATKKLDEWDLNRLHYGFIANEVEKLFPDIVTNAGTAPSIKRGLEYDAFIPMLVKVVQQQQKIIENQQQRIEQLEKQIKKSSTR